MVTIVLSEDLLPATHPARLLWDALGVCDLTPFLVGVGAVAHRAGRPRTDPRLLLALWGYAFSRGITCACRLAALATTGDVGVRWLLGDIPHVSHDVLSDFLVDHRAALSALLTEVLAQLVHRGALRLPLDVAAFDGTRVRADAAMGSFHTAPTLATCRDHATTHLRAMLAAYDAGAPRAAQALGQAAAWTARVVRAEHAAAAVAAARAAGRDKRRAVQPARGSTTDPDARRMWMADGATAPAYNAQLAVSGTGTGGPCTIVGLSVCQDGNDKGGVAALLDDVE